MDDREGLARWYLAEWSTPEKIGLLGLERWERNDGFFRDTVLRISREVILLFSVAWKIRADF